jgi:transcriptional pleiotropic regulator of transition state genes
MLKSTGMTRPIDTIGRIVIPKELRKTMGLVENESTVQIFVNDGDIVLRKYEPGCIFCGNCEGVKDYKGKSICKDCIKEMMEARA